MPNSLETALSQALADNNYHFSTQVEQQFIQYLRLLERWNKVFNLTAIRDPNEMVSLHILDSLSISPYLHGSRLIDVGTGAGLPGIPLALAFPDKHIVLLDSNSKKTRFLIQATHELGLNNTEVVHDRCEDFNPTVGFDSILSRAFSSIAVMLEHTQHLAGGESQFLAMKGVYPVDELKELPVGFEVKDVHELIIQGLNAKRHLVCLQKT